MKIPDEDRGPGEEGLCGILRRTLYGTHDAAYNWTQAYTTVLCEKLGFRKGESSPCSFVHLERGLNLVVHGDDFFIEGPRDELAKLDLQLKEHFQLKTEILGPDSKKGDVQEIRFLNRVLAWHSKGMGS